MYVAGSNYRLHILRISVAYFLSSGLELLSEFVIKAVCQDSNVFRVR